MMSIDPDEIKSEEETTDTIFKDEDTTASITGPSADTSSKRTRSDLDDPQDKTIKKKVRTDLEDGIQVVEDGLESAASGCNNLK